MSRLFKKGYDLCVCGHERWLHHFNCTFKTAKYETCDCRKFYYDDRRRQKREQNERKRNG